MSYERVTTNLAGAVRHATLEGRPHLVVPTVMIVEGVLNGSRGPMLYPGDELSRAPHVWDHKPIVVGHPDQGSACDPTVLNARKVGVVLNTKWQAPKLRVEAWLDIERCRAINSRIVDDLLAGRKIEVSTGLYVDECLPAGTFNGLPYSAVARNFSPDHLAILVDQVGACSIADGAGMLQLNQSKPPMFLPQFQRPEPTQNEIAQWLLSQLRRQQGPPILIDNAEDEEEDLPLPTMNFGDMRPAKNAPLSQKSPQLNDDEEEEDLPLPHMW